METRLPWVLAATFGLLCSCSDEASRLGNPGPSLVTVRQALTAPVSMGIKLDYFGYRPADVKVAVLTANPGSIVQVLNGAGDVVYTVPTDGGSITYMGVEGQPTGDEVWRVDFSGLSAPGSYRLYVPSQGTQSYAFVLASDVYTAVGEAAIKTFYYQRCGVAHPAPYAAQGYRDDGVCHAYLTASTPATGAPNYGTLNLSGGWHDAGDYNKYVWGAVENAIVPMLTAYEDNPGLFYDGQLGVPESGNGVPDILDEVKVEIDWLLKMRRPDGVVLGKVFDEAAGAAGSNSVPPSNAVHAHHYYGPFPESRAVFAGSLAIFARVCAEHGDPYGNAAALRAIAVDAWENGAKNDPETNLGYKVWAAAEVFRADPTVTSARNYIDTYTDNFWTVWSDLWAVGQFAYTHAAYAYIQTPAATPSVRAAMLTAIGNTVDSEMFANAGFYGNSLRGDMYYWGSNSVRAGFGWGLMQAVKLGATPPSGRTAAEITNLAQEFLHAMHGKNPLNMVYLTNMAAYGGEHSSFQMYHSWFGVVKDPDAVAWYIGLPAGVVEPDFPYFKGTDNYGVNDNNHSLYGPLPGLVVGGPNKDYSGRASPPSRAPFYERFYRDWTSDARNGFYNTKVWEITESSIGYQGFYIGLVSAFMNPALPPTIPDAPTTLSATAISAGQINLAWSDISLNEDQFAIERRVAGGSYAEVATVGSNQTSYSDTGLSAGTTYDYRVLARNGAGNSAYSNEASATTTSLGASAHVQSIVAQRIGYPVVTMQATVAVVDGLGVPVQGATVAGTFSGLADGLPFTKSASATTNASGVAVISGGKKKNAASLTFCVGNITHATLAYDPSANVLTCDNSD
jgi:endoglucanase